MAAIQISFTGQQSASKFDGMEYWFRIKTSPGGLVVRNVVVRALNEHKIGWLEKFRTRHEEEPAAKLALHDAIKRWAVPKLIGLGAELVSSDETLHIEPDYEDFDQMGTLPKQCAYQERRGRDLFCLAADTTEGADFGQTSLARCGRCNLPDTRVLCAHAMHITAYSRVYAPEVKEVTCDRGMAAVGLGKECVPGGNECWTCLIEIAPKAKSSEQVSPMIVAEAFDFLSTVWLLKFPTASRLVSVSSVASIMNLGMNCSSADDFKSMIISLGDVLKKTIIVDDALMTANSNGNFTMVPIDRVAKAIMTRDPTANPATSAFDTLRAISAIRNGFGHPNDAKATRKRVSGAITLGMNWPPSNWDEAWAVILRSLHGALREIRITVEHLP